MTVCAHCPVALLSVSVGFVHADTHNTHGADGHVAEPSNVIYIDEWEPRDPTAPYPPKRADVTGTRLDPWLELTPYERDSHRRECEGCVLCNPHRVFAWCRTEGMETEVMEDGNCTCGSIVLMGTDYSDVKAAER